MSPPQLPSNLYDLFAGIFHFQYFVYNAASLKLSNHGIIYYLLIFRASAVIDGYLFSRHSSMMTPTVNILPLFFVQIGFASDA
ncbi:hypothetical protein ARMSODRAFT_1026902 [Armillaria solidipes]|uniref:Uncharacterized protein n=1 Tax=Armillaria solidipes TaxID=1076256 RepID=A0A2H3B1X8_9AGAR|nr:hypothetical protein ARMSODRAFT_1026902 [Armillaria solidipes]